ncbi:hypothetical protein [Legionella brunensis]|nr:hypothetical protein [Legionella brunensis]
MKNKYRQAGYLIFGIALSFSLVCQANWGLRHYHGHDPSYYGPGYYGPYGPGGYYDRGWYPGWGGPNVIINVPVPGPVYVPQYIPQCEVVEICNSNDECWLARECN